MSEEKKLPSELKELVWEFEQSLKIHDIVCFSFDKQDVDSIKDTYQEAFHDTISYLEDVINCFKEIQEDFDQYFHRLEEEKTKE